ncbi:phosphoglycolate phosphatase [Vandammella animalimorsus]|nr:phosphoglycolate phosphatase [Vandammella animalimorsus]
MKQPGDHRQDTATRPPAMSHPHRSARAHLGARPIHAVLLDLDGTLVDTLDEFELALGHMLRSLQLPPTTRATIARTIGKGSEHLVRSILAGALAQAGLPHGEQAVAQRFDEAMRLYFIGYDSAGHEHAKVYPGVREGLQGLQALGLPMAVVTNKPMRLARPLLDATGLAGQIEFLYAGDSFARRKPDPYPLLQACERLGQAPQQVLMIGDSANDAAAARAAGCAIALLRYGFNHGEPIEQVAADAYFDSIAEIAAQLAAAPA